VWNALATDGGSVYFTTGNTHFPWCVWPYDPTNCPVKDANGNVVTEPPNNNGLSMIKVDKDTGHPDWKFNTVDFNHDGDPDWAAGATVMFTSCGELIASVQKDGWSYAVDPRGSMRWQFPPTIETDGLAAFLNYVHGDDDYRRPGAAWNDMFIVRTGGEDLVADTVSAGYNKLHALNACATSEQDRVRWIAYNIPTNTANDNHISFSSPTVTGGIVFIGTYQNPMDSSGRASRPPASRFVLPLPTGWLARRLMPSCRACSRSQTSRCPMAAASLRCATSPFWRRDGSSSPPPLTSPT